MTIFWIVLLIILLALQFTVLGRGAPYVPTRHKQRQQALDLLNLKSGQTLIDLGSGDGAMLAAAAQRGIQAVGFEINPLLVLVAKIRTRKYGEMVKIYQGNLWNHNWPNADAVFVFLTANYMDKLDEQMKKRFEKEVKLVAYGFSLNSKKPIKKAGAFFLYKYA